MITGLTGQDLPQWMASARDVGLPGISSFAKGLEHDLDAVTNGLTLLVTVITGHHLCHARRRNSPVIAVDPGLGVDPGYGNALDPPRSPDPPRKLGPDPRTDHSRDGLGAAGYLGRSYEVTGLDMIRVRDGQLVEHRPLLDSAAMQHQLGEAAET
jgi:hypothetical protein